MFDIGQTCAEASNPCAPCSRPSIQLAAFVSRPRLGVAAAAQSLTVRHLNRPPRALVCEEPPAPDARRGQKTRALSRHQRIRVSAMPARTHLCGGGYGVRARTPLRPVLEHMVDLPAPVLHPPQATHTKVSGNRTPPIRRSPKVPARARGLVSQPSIAVGNAAARDRLASAVSGSFREA